MDPKDIFAIEERDIPFGERLTNAVSSFFYLLICAPVCLVLAPITFFRVLFTTKQKVIIPLIRKPNAPFGTLDPDMPDWKKDHKEMYGDEDDG